MSAWLKCARRGRLHLLLRCARRSLAGRRAFGGRSRKRRSVGLVLTLARDGSNRSSCERTEVTAMVYDPATKKYVARNALPEQQGTISATGGPDGKPRGPS